MTRPDNLGPDRPRSGRRQVRGRAAIGPIVVLAVVVLAPAALLAGIWRWAEQSIPPPETVPQAVPPASPPLPALPTALLSFRRTPGPLVERVADERFAELLATELAQVGDSSCAAVSLEGRLVGSANPDVAVIPASNQKLPVAAVALRVLGDDHVFRTEVRGVELDGGVLRGDLHLVGGGDPLLVTDDHVDTSRHPVFNTTRLDTLVDQLIESGLERVEGDVAGDGSRYDDEFSVPSWGPDITRNDAGPYDALLVNGGLLFGAGHGLNPNQSAASELNRLLVARGVTVTGRNRAAPSPAGLTVLAAVDSVPLTGVIEVLLQTSDNNSAEMLVKEIGYAARGDGSRLTGLAVVREHLESLAAVHDNADFDESVFDELVLDDGSGLSRENRLTCPALVALLADEGPDGELAAALPVMGVSGTLADQLVGTPAQGAVRAKTGTLTGVKALSGFMPAGGGGSETFAFSLILDDPDAADPEVHLPRWAGLVEVLGRYPIEVSSDPFEPRRAPDDPAS